MPDPETSSDDSAVQQQTSDSTPEQKPEQKPESEEPDCSSFPRPGDCNPDVNDLACTAAGDKAKAAYNDSFAKDLETAGIDYETTRAAYRAARQEVRLTVEDFRNQIRHLLERVGCQIEQKRVRKCLDDAFCDVLEELKCCPTKDPCCSEDCDFPLGDIEKLSVKELTTLITAYQARIDEAKACFAELKGEPEALKTRVEDVKKRIDDINSELGGDAAKLDLKKAYAEALVARWKISRVWGGFHQVQDFVDCLCDALTCWTKGCEAVYKLTGAKAVAECKDKAKQDRCDKLRNQTVEQILAGYDRRCAKKDCEEPSDGGDKPGHNHDGDEECDCHDHDHDHDHGHHHKHHHHHRHHCCCEHHDNESQEARDDD